MDRTSVDSAIEQLSKLLSLPCLASTGMDNQVKALLLDLRFLQIFFSCLATLKPADDQEIIKDGFIGLTRAQATLEIAGRGGLDVQELELLMSNLQENVKRLKPQVRDTICYGVLTHHHEGHSSCTNEEISVEFMDSILLNLERLLLIVRAKDDVMNDNNIVQPLVKKQMESLDERLRFTRNFIDFATKRYCRSSSCDKLVDFLKLFQAWTRTAASLSLLYWVEMDCMDQNVGHRINTMLSDSIKEIMPCTPRVTRMYIEILKDSKISRPDTLLLGDILARFVDFLILENLVDSMEGDDTEIVREGLIFLISFLMDPPMELRIGAGRIASLKQIEAAISKVTSLISMGDYSFVPGFREKVHKIKTEVKKHHVQMPKSSESNCPKIPRMGFIHFLLINLEEMMKSNSTDFIRFAKHKVVAIHRELHSLSLSLKDIMDFQNQYKYDEPKPIGRHLYSLLVSSQIERSQSHISSVASQYFQSFKLLHILNLEGICLEFSFLEEIMSIVHLRYLAIQGNFMRIPSSIANLWNLRTLVVKGLQSLIVLPETIWKMKSLKHVHASDMAVISPQQGDHDHQLEDASLLVNNMNTFSTLALHRIADTEKLLRRLSGLQKLKCVVSSSQLYNKNEIQFPALAYLKNLQSLTLCTIGDQGPASCSWMHIQFQAFGFPSTLRKLTLYKLGLPWSAISIIQQLPNLEVLKLREQSFRGKRWDMGREDEEMEDREIEDEEMEDEEFCNLRFLELSNLNIEEWNVANDPFPCLEQLVVGDCYSLVEIPFYFGRITTLQMIELHRCSNKVKSSADKILLEQQDWGNDELQILILDS
ncbi:hypothetical protein ACH5RR_030018 [Cinchona calisaya]|uniref:Late blight resistance protein R1A-like N-terminal domain-containing protein n=1 Tax=Cinchona calisaya TaxID=153742 RepID=A0ABD2YXP3_9GENT